MHGYVLLDMNQKHVVPEMCAVVFVRDRKRHAIASLNTGSLCCSEWKQHGLFVLLPNTSKSYYGIVRLLFAFPVYSYLVLVLALGYLGEWEVCSVVLCQHIIR